MLQDPRTSWSPPSSWWSDQTCRPHHPHLHSRIPSRVWQFYTRIRSIGKKPNLKIFLPPYLWYSVLRSPSALLVSCTWVSALCRQSSLLPSWTWTSENFSSISRSLPQSFLFLEFLACQTWFLFLLFCARNRLKIFYIHGNFVFIIAILRRLRKSRAFDDEITLGTRNKESWNNGKSGPKWLTILSTS